jgi:uncharacterized protein
MQSRIYLSSLFGLLIGSSVLYGCSTNSEHVKNDAVIKTENTPKTDDYQVVDCLLPGQVRSLGTSTYMTPRRPILTTAADCRIRGGEFVEYDRADYKTALKVWMPAAEAGDADAQANVGEIFERGLGGSPNYKAAAIWYQKSASQGNSRAQFNLGTLYEQGLGVQKDKLLALNWYRKAWGMPEDALVFQSAAAEAENELRAQLQKNLDEKNQQITLLKSQVANLQANLKKANSQDAENEIISLRNWIKNLEAEQLIAKNDIDKLPQIREPKAAEQPAQSAGKAIEVNTKGMNFGKYYALIIANQNYDNIDDLSTPHADAMRAQKILSESYGFNVTLLLDQDNASVMKAINQLNELVGDDDNLLIFYAGHGTRITTGEFEAGYWLPRNANTPPDDTFWVSNEFVTRHLARLKAKRVMVVADSCYAGLLSSSPGYLFMSQKADYSEDYIRYKLPKRSRLLLSSGGDLPVLDNQGQGHSVFARAFLDALEQSTGIMSGPELFLKIKNQVSGKAESVGFHQIPEFKPIKGAGHEVGDFFFVKQS